VAGKFELCVWGACISEELDEVSDKIVEDESPDLGDECLVGSAVRTWNISETLDWSQISLAFVIFLAFTRIATAVPTNKTLDAIVSDIKSDGRRS
jgi:hypothetical protein